MLALKQVLGEAKPFEQWSPPAQHWFQTVTILSGGFIVTSLLWGAALAALLDGHCRRAAAYLAVAGVLALFGVIHSPLPAEAIALPGDVLSQLAQLPTERMREAASFQTPYHWTAAYGLAAALLVGLGAFGKDRSHAMRDG